MANIKSAKKRVKTTDKRTARNRHEKEALKAVMKQFDAAIAAKDLEKAAELRTTAEKKLKKAASRNTISKQAASRHVSQITKRLNAVKAE